MTNDDLLLLQTSVFTGITTDEIRDMLSCLSARETTFIKDEIIFSYGETITGIGIVLEGSVHIVKEDFWGNANLMAECAPGDIFGEAYAINSTEPLEMNIFAASTCRILFLEVSKILTVCPSACAFHNRLIRNNVSVPEKFPVKPQVRTYVQAHHQRETALLPVHGVEKSQCFNLYHSIQPPAACRLSLCRPLCHVQ